MMKINMSYLGNFLLLIAMLTSCKETPKNKIAEVKEVSSSKVSSYGLMESDFDTLLYGREVRLYWLENKDLKLAITNYGGRFVGLWVPDNNGKPIDVVVGMGNIRGYIESTEPYFGATIGRVGNRIAKGKFILNGKQYSIPINNGKNSLHGGKKGFQDVVWYAEQPNKNTLVLTYTSPHMEEGFPGNLNAKVTYSLTDSNSVKMEYEATTDKPTVVNLTNHAFFNLNGEGSGTILNHLLQIYADKFTPVDEGLIPTGKLENVKGTPLDFTEPHQIGERIGINNVQLQNGNGYDHNYVLIEIKDQGMGHAAKIIGDKSGIMMDVYTKEPGIQFYSGNFMASRNIFKSGIKDDFRTAFALETQHFPDAPNQSGFPTIVLNPGEIYYTVSEYKFSTE